MILTKELLQANEACKEGYRFALGHDLIGRPLKEVVSVCEDLGEYDYALYVESLMGKREISIMPGKIQVFNPKTGLHTSASSTEEAIALYQDIAEKILAAHMPQVVVEGVDGNGRQKWVPLAQPTVEVTVTAIPNIPHSINIG